MSKLVGILYIKTAIKNKKLTYKNTKNHENY